MCQRFIYKIHSQDIIKANKDYKLSFAQAREQKEIITLADSQVIRFIDNINQVDRKKNQEEVKHYFAQLKAIKKLPKSIENSKAIKGIYSKLKDIQIIKEYVCVIIDNANDIYEFKDNGFKFNGVQFTRLVGTSNGVKKSVVVYSSLTNELNERLDNGRDKTVPLVPAKFEAYKGLACSASVPLSYPKGVIVVDDLEVSFRDKVIEIKDNINGGEPLMEEKISDITLNANDGFGLMSPSLAEQWSKDLQVDYLISGCCIRNAFVKGMAYTFDFHKFAKEIAHKETVTDVWGNSHNINDIDLILTASMMKLWQSYLDYDTYYQNCIKNGYTFSATKVCPNVLDEERELNYQFIQSYELDDNDIYDLISPSVNKIKSILHTDINKAILFLRGTSITDDNVLSDLNNDCIKALMIDERMINDPYIIDKINMMIKRKINDTKIGVISVKGNYQILSGDPYALCQHMFGLVDNDEDYGLLKAGEIYSKYWCDKNIDKVVCFRAPMTCHNNIRKMNVVNNDKMSEWYKYMNTVMILNCHDTTTHALNGCDYDGDICFSTNNLVLMNHTKDLPAIVCVQRKAEKQIINEDLLIEANKNSFGDDIGSVTNKITAMFDVQSQFNKDSEEYAVLDYRIKCGQHYQQNCIDKTKGIIAEPMPKYWYTKTKSDQDEFFNSICANKKPYFMNYIYSDQRTKYNNFIKNCNNNGLFDYRKTLKELQTKNNLSKEEKRFMKSYNIFFPVFDGNCTMNRLCHMVEQEFDGYVCSIKQESDFDYAILKSEIEYSKKDYNKIKRLYEKYRQEQIGLKAKFSNSTKRDFDDYAVQQQVITNKYKELCYEICSNKYELCNIVLDLCYKTNQSKKFAWEVCGDVIIENLLKKNNNRINYLVADENGSIEYQGQRFTKKSMTLEVED